MDINVDFYEPLLAGLSIKDLDGNGVLTSVFNPDKLQIVMVGGKTLVLPLKEVLREGKKEDRIVFHPLSENVTRGESDTIKALRDYIQWRHQSVGILLITELARVAASPSEHKNYPAKAKKYLQQISDFDEANYKTLLTLLKNVKPDPDRRIISLTLRRGSKTKDDGIMRSCLVHFPIFEDLAKDDLSVFGSKIPSKKAKARLAKLFEIVFGDEETRESFSYGSRNMDAPYLHALLTVHVRLAEHFNALVATHAKILGEELTTLLTTPLDWVPMLEEFNLMRNMVPPQMGNEGAVTVEVSADKVVAKRGLPSALLEPPADREPTTAPWEGQRTADDPVRIREERAVRSDRNDRDDRRPDRAPTRAAPRTGMSLSEYLSDERNNDRDPDRRSGLRSDRSDARANSRAGSRTGGFGLGRSSSRRPY